MTELGSSLRDNLIGGDKPLITEDILVPSGTPVRGTVMGRVKQSTPTTGTAAGGNTGDGTVTAVSGGVATKKGTYTITCITAETNGGTFQVTDPDGNILGTVKIQAGAGASADFKSSQINFTVTDGATDFAAGDSFTIAVTDGVPATGTAGGGNTGDGTMTGVEGRRQLKIGTYTLECIQAVTNGGVFSVTDPDGNSLPQATVGTAYVSDQIAFILNDGATDFALGDTFTLAVTIDPRQCVPLDKSATDGSSAPYCVLAEDVDASVSGQRAVGYLEGEFNERQLAFASGTDVEDVRDAMRDLGMIVVPSVSQGAV